MTMIVEFRRTGMSRVSEDAIPLVARVRAGSKYGEDMLRKTGILDVSVRMVQWSGQYRR